MGITGALVARQGAQHDVDPAADELGRGIRMPIRRDFFDELVYDLEPELLMGHFTAAETEGHLDLHFLAQEIDRVTQFNAEIMGVDRGAKLDFFNPIGVLVFFGFLLALRLFVAVLAVIDESANRRGGIRGHFDEIDTLLAGHGQSVSQGDDAQLLTLGSDQSDFASTDFPVNPNERTGRRRITRRERAAQDTLFG